VGEWFARWTYRHAAFISVRDEASKKRVESWGLNKEIVQTFDPVFSLMAQQKKMEDTKNLFLIIPRSNSSESFVNRARTIAEGRRWDHIVILSLAPGNARERQVCERIAQHVGTAKIVMVSTLDHLMEHVSRASFVLSQRYHGALAALALRKQLEVVPQGEGDKLEELMKNRDPEALSELMKEGEEALKKVLLTR
jgi:polysaccharide pyruvyl transferase WcaK-like protein